MIISASRRTDVPAFFAREFMDGVRAGFLNVPHPRNPRLVSRVELSPSGVEAIVFWTRDARPLLPRLRELDDRGYAYYFQYTLLDGPTVLDPEGRPDRPRSRGPPGGGGGRRVPRAVRTPRPRPGGLAL